MDRAEPMLSKNFSYQSLIPSNKKIIPFVAVDLAQKVTTCSCLMIACALTFQNVNLLHKPLHVGGRGWTLSMTESYFPCTDFPLTYTIYI